MSELAQIIRVTNAADMARHCTAEHSVEFLLLLVAEYARRVAEGRAYSSECPICNWMSALLAASPQALVVKH